MSGLTLLRRFGRVEVLFDSCIRSKQHRRLRKAITFNGSHGLINLIVANT
jgi:hypothetical protein